MTLQSKREYFQEIVRRYHESDRKAKSRILDEFCVICGYERNYAIRLLNWGHRRNRRKPGRQSKYRDPAFLAILQRVWATAHYPCGKLLKRVLGIYLRYYERHYGAIFPPVREKLLGVSAATIDRILTPIRARYKKGRSLTKPGALLREEILTRATYWDVTLPGFVETDTVAHCGESSKGPFILSVTLTDILTDWTECRAIWTKIAENTVEAIRDIEASLPFPICGFDCDNGSEFLNDHLVRYFQNKRIPMTRSRPYRKNDNAHVEQKNWMHARQVLGYQRLDNPDLVPLINDLYKHEWSQFTNFFKPTMKLKEKIRVGSKVRRKYHEPMTPFERVLQCPHVDENKKQELKALFETLDPFELNDRIRVKQQRIKKLARVTFEDWQLLNQPAFPLEQ